VAASPVRVAIGFADSRTGANAESGIGGIASLLQEDVLVRGARDDGRPSPAVAERWEASADGLTWRFYLPPGLRFQDGTPLDATVAAASARAMLASTRMYGGLRDVTDIEAAGPLELIIRLSRRSSILLDSLSNIGIRSAGGAPIGTFRLVSRDSDSIRLAAFTGDARPRSNVTEVDIRRYPSGRSAWSAMMRGELDVLYEVSPDALEFIEQSSQAQLKSFLRPYVHMLGLNMRHPILRDRQVRVAMNTAVNRDDLIKAIIRGHGVPAVGYLWPRHWLYDEHLEPFAYDPREAQRLLDAAGLPVKPSADRHMPSRFRFTCLVPIGDRHERMALILQRQLVDVGIDMQLESVPLRALGSRIASGDYEAFLFDTAAANLDWTYSFWHSPEPPSPTILNSGYTGADAALDRLREARNETELRAAAVAVQRVMREDPPAVFLFWREMARAVSTRFILPNITERDIIKTLPQWQLAAPPPEPPVRAPAMSTAP
jgi:peptide/nickel transport system substrate-binding protein